MTPTKRQRSPRKPRPQTWRVPDRWSDYSTIGEVIPDARIIAFKTPLRSQFFKPGEDRFEVSNLLDEIHARGGELGLVVDLTYTTRYYDPEDFIRNGIEYQKIFCPGHDAEALRTIGAEFVDLLHWFFKKNAHNEKWVAVHCTHGINRTGALICRYLVEELGWSVEKAVEVFQTTRGHNIERLEYLDSLQKPAETSTTT